MFITRIELHNAKSSDYDTLHSAMSKQGYTQTIVSGEGQVCKLPTAEYCLVGNYLLQDALNQAQYAANLVGKECSIIVSETNKVMWSGLAKVG